MPLVLRAVSALTYRVISIELLAVAIGLIIGEYNEAAIVVWLFNLGDVLEALTENPGGRQVVDRHGAANRHRRRHANATGRLRTLTS